MHYIIVFAYIVQYFNYAIYCRVLMNYHYIYSGHPGSASVAHLCGYTLLDEFLAQAIAGPSRSAPRTHNCCHATEKHGRSAGQGQLFPYPLLSWEHPSHLLTNRVYALFLFMLFCLGLFSFAINCMATPRMGSLVVLSLYGLCILPNWPLSVPVLC